MPQLKIDNQTVEVPEGTTVLAAARQLGLDIPTLCYMEGFEAGASCMVCAVQLAHNGQFIPACGSRVVDGMEVVHDGDEVREARRMALELLFSDHLGDCLSPCQRICPAHLNIPAVLRHVREGEPGLAAAVIRRDLALGGILCQVCHRPCESGCRRAPHDEAVAIADLVLHAMRTEAEAGDLRVPPGIDPRTGSVAVAGSGFAGLSAAWFLAIGGFAVTVFTGDATASDTIAKRYPDLEGDRIESELRLLEAVGVCVQTARGPVTRETLDALAGQFDAVILTAPLAEGGDAPSLGLKAAGKGIAVGKETMMTSRSGIFAVGRAVRPGDPKPVQSVADGKAVAVCVGQFLSGETVRRPPKPFSCFIGKVDGAEMEEFLQDSSPESRALSAEDVDIDLAIRESNRCVHCNCAKADTCRMRELAMEYGVNPNRFSSGERLRFRRNVEHPLVRFEAGKCIRCGNCIKVAADRSEALGLTFIGRGFDVHVGVPFDESMDAGLLEAAVAAVESCPTGALSLKKQA